MVKWMTEVPERCDHPEENLSGVLFDILDQPYRNCKKCGTSICGREALQHLEEQRKQKCKIK